MNRLRYAIGSMIVLPLLLGACSSSSSSGAMVDVALASLEAKIPTRERASVRICESMVDGSAGISSAADALQFAMSSLTELDASDDPNGMKNALTDALIAYGDAVAAEDSAAIQDAGMGLATVCTDIVSGEYGK